MWCIYDNPDYFRRELWVDGLCVQWIDVLLVTQLKETLPPGSIDSAWHRPFRSGQVSGNAWGLVDKLGQAWM